MEIEKNIFGAEEWSSLPTLNIPAIKSQFNINAAISSLRAINIQTRNQDGETWVKYTVHPLKHKLISKGIVIPSNSPYLIKMIISSA